MGLKIDFLYLVLYAKRTLVDKRGLRPMLLLEDEAMEVRAKIDLSYSN